MSRFENNNEDLNKQLLELKQSYELLKSKYDQINFNHSLAIQALKEKDFSDHNLYNDAPINYHSLDNNACILDVNNTWLDTLGYKREEVIGKSIFEFLTPESIDSLKNQFPNLLKNSETHNVEFRMVRKDESIINILLDVRINLDESGNLKKTHCVFTDITKHKQAELKEKESETSYRILFNSVGDAIYIMDEDSTFIDVNEGALKMYGYPRDVLIGKNPLFVSAPGKNDLESVAVSIDKAFKGTPQQFEFWGLRANGEIFPKDVRIFCSTYFGKKVNIAMAQDITERKNAEAALLESERRYRELIELAVSGILVGSSKGIIIIANSVMLQLTGRSIDRLIGMPINEIFDPESLSKAPLRYDLLKEGKTVWNERVILRPDGTKVPIAMHAKMMPDGTYQAIFIDVTERRKAEETLRLSELKFKSLVESTSDMIWETNIAGKYTYVSPQFKTLLGYAPEEAIGKSPFEFIVDDNLDQIKQQSDSIVESAQAFNSLVNNFRCKDGKLVYFETSGVPVFDDQNKLLGYRGISRDITQRFLAERELHKLSLVVQQSPNNIIITNLKGEIEYINPFGCKLTGYEPSELIGKNPSIFSSGKTSPDKYTELWTNLSSGKGWEGIFHNRKKNGELFLENALIVPMKDVDNNITNYLAIKQDITKRVQTENKLIESEERYRGLFEGSPDAIMLADIETGMLVDANTMACELLGRSLEDILKLHFTQLHPERDLEFSIKSFQDQVQAFRNGLPIKPIENIIVRADGTEIPVEVMASSITLNGKKILQGVFRDISKRKKTQEELLKAKEKAEASDRLKTSFLNNISHELRTPLNGIIGFSEMLTQMDNTEQDRLEFTKLIKKSSIRLINTITSYIDISMIVSGYSEVHTSIFDLKPFLKDIYNQTIEICQNRNQSLDINLIMNNENLKIETDQLLLSKILLHLLDNASKFTSEGSITISHSLENDIHKFCVIDTGTGIMKEAESLIYETFVQKESSVSRGYEGSGLGLSIAKGFVKILGGDIWVDSKKDVGSSFCFTIPTTKGRTTSFIPSGGQTRIENNETQPLILIAEDDDSNYKYLEIVLKRASYNIIRALDGYETVELCRSNPNIRLVITDLKMPNMDGFEATRQIRQLFPTLPVIVSSAYVSSKDETEAYNAGCNGFVIKPIIKSKLLETIENLLRTG